MRTKLTLTLDYDVIERAKKHARTRGMSLSRLIEVHLDRLTAGSRDAEGLTTDRLDRITGLFAEEWRESGKRRRGSDREEKR